MLKQLPAPKDHGPNYYITLDSTVSKPRLYIELTRRAEALPDLFAGQKTLTIAQVQDLVRLMRDQLCRP